MHASALSLATSIPTTTRLFCAIIHSLPCSVRAQKAHATVRVEEDTGSVPRSPTGSQGLRARSGSDPATGGWSEPPVRTFWQNLQTQELEVSRKAIARGKPGCLGCTCQIRVRSLSYPLH